LYSQEVNSEEVVYNPLTIYLFELNKENLSWLPVLQKPFSIIFLRNKVLNTTRIVAAENVTKVLDYTVSPNSQFKKTSTTFGQWKDQVNNQLYGIKFTNEDDLNKATFFIHNLNNSYTTTYSL
jgi:hypothetical protein